MHSSTKTAVDVHVHVFLNVQMYECASEFRSVTVTVRLFYQVVEGVA